MIDWSIQARAHQCQSCGRGFRDKEALHTLLFDDRNAYSRLDVCESCWASQHSQAASHRKGFISHWLGVHMPPAPPPPEPIQKETAEGLLRKLVERPDSSHAAACFILAVMLERKRLLKARGQTGDTGHRVLLYEHAKSGELFTIPDPNLQLDQLEAVQRDVADLMERGLDAPPVPASPPSPPADAASADAGVLDPAVAPSPS